MQTIQLAHGSGGVATNQLIESVFKKYLQEFLVGENEDGGVFYPSKGQAISTDSYVVSPVIFSGGDIGKLSICGSSNDVTMMGAKPEFITLGFILEEGLEISLLEKLLQSMSSEIRALGLKILSADTKVVERGNVDKIFINTTAIGSIIKTCSIKQLAQNDVIILSSPIGAHGGVIFCERNQLHIHSDLKSDCRSLYPFLESLLKSSLPIHTLRDATRGGLAAVLNEWAQECKNDILIFEDRVKIPHAVQGICEILGFEAYSLANEGAFVLATPKDTAEKVLSMLHKSGLEDAMIIGEIVPQLTSTPRVILQNAWGSKRFLDSPTGELLPRIC